MTTTATEAAANVKIEIKELPDQEYLGLRFTSAPASVGHDVEDGFKRLYARISEANSQPSGPPFLIASPPDAGAMQVEIGAPCSPVPEAVAGLHAGRLDGGRAATVLHRGPYDRIGRAYEAVFAWIGTHGYHPRGDAREVYLNGPGDVKTPNDYLTEVVVPIR